MPTATYAWPMAELLVGVIVGGVVSLISALAVDTVRSRRESSQRWDRDRLSAAIEFVRAAQDLAGDQYRRGRAVQDVADKRDDLLLRREEEGRQSLSALWIAAAKAELLLPDVRSEIQRVIDTGRAIRDLADEGFSSGDERWRRLRDDHHAAIAQFSHACRLPLRIGVSLAG